MIGYWPFSEGRCMRERVKVINLDPYLELKEEKG